ncbi:MAG: hypothetical protein WBA42_14860 [Mesorhizobium sp.]
MHSTLTRNITMSAILLVALCGTAYAGENNQITIKQDGLANSLTVDQSQASNSVVGGADLNSDNVLSLGSTAKQLGNGNTADLRITDDGGIGGGQIGLFQSNSSQSGLANNAVVSVLGSGLGLVSQNGEGNVANISVKGTDTIGSVSQIGNLNNVGTLTEPGLKIEGENAKGSVTQNGNGNNTSLAVFGNGTSVDYTLNGDNITNMPAGGVQVISNGATVTITQTRF